MRFYLKEKFEPDYNCVTLESGLSICQVSFEAQGDSSYFESSTPHGWFNPGFCG
jgi:hypothetical protein